MKRTVAFLDILGFRQKLEQLGVDELAKQYRTSLGLATSFLIPHDETIFATAGHPWLFGPTRDWRELCDVRIFSDSIILFSKDEGREACLRLLVYCWRVQQALIATKLLVRGGVAYGEMAIDFPNQIFLGHALTRAYELEGQQNWSGVAVDDTVDEAFPELLPRTDNGHFIVQYPVPMKSGKTQRISVLNWRWQLILEEGVQAHIDPFRSTTPSIREKLDNTLDFARAQRPFAYPNDESTIPVELRSFWVGTRLPPFSHGDEL